MIPSVLSRQVRQAIEDFLTTRYMITTPRFANTVRDFVKRGEMFKGPYVSFQLPFNLGETAVKHFPEMPRPFPDYLHQQQAFERLAGSSPKPTLVATGTGSGKTEAFLYPILEHCRQYAGQRGVKAILIYPMNALATDQAKRVADIIFNTPSLKGHVTAGLYVGGLSAKPSLRMTEDSIITQRWAMHKEPPDILLTNYKMLDYLMVQPKTQDIWQHNRTNGLQFIVVDELHTFDGAQGTDLACLLRRLKRRLKSSNACPVGTSATLGAEDADTLLEFANDIFGANFEPASVVTESRLSAPEFNNQALWKYSSYPNGDDIARLNPNRYATLVEYIAAQYEIWFGRSADASAVQDESWAPRLGQSLKEHAGFKNLIQMTESATRPMEEVAEEFKQLLDADAQEHAHLVLESLLALISFARDPDKPEKPLLNVRVQFWVRELRRMLVSSGEDATLRWFDDLKAARQGKADEVDGHFPLTICRNCGAGAWAAFQQSESDPLQASPSRIYEAFFRRHKEITLVFPDDAPQRPGAKQLCLDCFHTVGTQSRECRECQGTNLLEVCIPSLSAHKGGRLTTEIKCPYCTQVDSFSIVGAQSASLCSVGIGQLFGSRYNDDKKVITFSNSVQDASHRAGFFQARTYQFAIRTALSQHILQIGKDQSLHDLQDSFVHALRQQHDEAGFVGEYIAPNMTWMRDYQDLVKEGRMEQLASLIERITERLRYEVLQTFGLQARLGRNLENIRFATAGPDPERLTQVAHKVLEELRNTVGGLEDLTVDQVRKFATGLIYRLRTSGGIADPVNAPYIKSGGNGILLTDRHKSYLPRLSRRSARPAFLCNFTAKNFLRLGNAGRKTWLGEWATKSLFWQKAVGAFAHEAVGPILDELVEAGQLKLYKIADKKRVWGVPPDCLTLTTQVASARCTLCRTEICFPKADHEIWENMPCPRFECIGSMRQGAIAADDYYRTRYQTHDVVRVVAEEHTGLLEREDREAVENAFMEPDRRPWHPNVLSCTPTLELGVDIGDLSTVIQTAVPPQKSNYIQRIGRAGRHDGNALALSVATASPHDLYYYADPLLMMAGPVSVPGIFLEAPAVLKRQLAALTMDCWVATGIGTKAVDRRVQKILGRVANRKSDGFPFNWLGFVDEQAEELLAAFESLFSTPNPIQKTILRQMSHYLGLDTAGEGLTLREEVIQAFTEAYHERQDLERRRQAVTREIKKLDEAVRDQNYQKDRRELIRHRAALYWLKAALNTKNVFNFLTDAGILPNYGFPQSSVSLKSIIVYGENERSKDADDGSEKKAKGDDYIRPGMLAIRELAPGNTFYAGQRKIRITQIDVKKSRTEQWRLCSNCSFSQRAARAKSIKCPKCKAMDWQNSGRVFNMARMTTVTAVSGDRSSRSHDETEERERNFQHVRTFVQFDEKDGSRVYACSDNAVPFGFQYIKKAKVRMINSGTTDPDREPLLIAGREQKTHGFSSCPACGYVRQMGKTFKHEFGCKKAGAPASENEDVFLYHEYESEAMRVLLPTVSTASESTEIDSFCAALHMGLKDYMKGQLDHLRTEIQDDPIEDLEFRKTFVFVLDTVPGGTGYLDFLLKSPNNILQVLRTALNRLKACECQQEPEADGCYRCLFAYRNNYKRDRISRKAAMEVLELILFHGGELKETKSLDTLPFNELLESICEQAFIRRLGAHAGRSTGWSFRNTEIKGNPGYELVAGKYTWIVECQVALGPRQDVVVHSRPDFVLWPQDIPGARPIAVFADGFAYHRGIVGDDTRKRMAILASGGYWVWSVTWDDLHSSDGQFEDFLTHDPVRFNWCLDQFGLNRNDFGHLRGKGEANSMTMLLAHLADPTPLKWRQLAYAYAMALVDLRKSREAYWLDKLQEFAPESFVDAIAPQDDDRVGMRWTNKKGALHSGLFWVRASYGSLQTLEAAGMQAGVYINDSLHSDYRFKSAWNGFLFAMNVLQHLPNSGFFCWSGIRQEGYEELARSWDNG
ncbi:MAG: DEAD/DEAH box helicase [Bacteroidota bacterium]|nr:DEAD/DEAH box helicase [Bacteroidota bacterium]